MIYCNGDSFTYGTELYDHVFFKEIHPGFILKKDMHETRLKSSHQKKYEDLILSKNLNKDEITLIHGEYVKRAWPSRLEKLLNIPTVNAGLGGSSMDSICDRTISDILDLKSKGKKIDLVVIQVTFADRFDICCNDKAVSVVSGQLPYSRTKMGEMAYEYAKIRVANETEFSFYKNWLMNLIHLIDFFKANHFPYLLVESLPYMNPTGQYKELVNLENYINLEFDLSLLELCKTFSEDTPVMCPGGHVAEILHDELAKEIAKIYENRFRH